MDNQEECEHDWRYRGSETVMMRHYQKHDLFYCTKCLSYTQRYPEDELRRAEITARNKSAITT